MIDQLEKEIHEGMLDLYQHQSMSSERESIVYFYFSGIHNENITLKEEIERLNNIINRTTKYVESLSSSGRGCDIYEDIKQEILKELKGSDKE